MLSQYQYLLLGEKTYLLKKATRNRPKGMMTDNALKRTLQAHEYGNK